MLRRNNKRNLPKFQDFDELVISVPNTKAQYKKKFNIISPVDRDIQNCHECIGTYVTTDNPALKVTQINKKIRVKINKNSLFSTLERLMLKVAGLKTSIDSMKNKQHVIVRSKRKTKPT